MKREELERLMGQVEANSQIQAEMKNMKQSNKILADYYYNLFVEFKESGFDNNQAFQLVVKHLTTSLAK